VQVKSLGPVSVKGLTEPMEVFEVTGVGAARSRLQAAAARGLTRFVGRDQETEQLRKALEQARSDHGQVVGVVGEPGLGKSRLFFEFTHSHRTQGWLILESGSVSYGKATPYLPVIDLLKAYFKIQDRDDHREIREKVTGKLLTLDKSLESTLPAFLALLDVPVDDSTWQALDPPTPSADSWRRQAAFASRESGPASDPAIRGSALDRLREPGDAGELSGKSADEQAAPLDQLSPGIPAWLGQ
jgi:hypothetical protein